MAYIFDRLTGLINRGEDLPTLPTIVLRLHRVLDDPSKGAGDVAAVIEGDPALTARLLRAANSAAFSRGGQAITSINAAITRMGMNQVRAVCLVLSIVNAFAGRQKGTLDHRVFWAHSVTVATIVAQLWDRIGLARDITPEDAYTVGLLHDVGLLILDQHFAEDLAELLQHRPDPEAELWPFEEEHLGLDHGAIAGLLLGRWSLPAVVGETVAHHHHPTSAPDSCRQLAEIVETAESLCWEAGAELPFEGRPMLTARAALEQLGIPPREVDEIIADIPKVHEKSRSFLA
ncbi:MAG: HDOD domain-containing protein [Gemmatimonadaceae bacterium]|nr:HDOD domain-containing protein [Gemmatimonadaceae bacterium]